jgi:Na+/proline symporter
MRLSLVGVAIITGAMALMRNNIYELVGESSAFSLVSLFTPLLAGLYWPKASPAGAIVSMIAGMVVWFFTLLWLPEEPADHDPVWLHVPPMLYGLAASIAGMVAGSMWRPRAVPDAGAL